MQDDSKEIIIDKILALITPSRRDFESARANLLTRSQEQLERMTQDLEKAALQLGIQPTITIPEIIDKQHQAMEKLRSGLEILRRVNQSINHSDRQHGRPSEHPNKASAPGSSSSNELG